MQSSLLDQGLTLMLVGMGTVFVFLSVLVIAMSLMSSIAQRFVATEGPDSVSNEEVAAISAAIVKHRHVQHRNRPTQKS